MPIAITHLGLSASLSAFGWLVLATILGGIVGIEREWSRKPAGVRTQAVVAAAACLIVQIGEHLREAAPPGLAGDPTRALHAVITGIGFLGAGTILRDRRSSSVQGLTTAASLFLTAAIGAAVGSGMALYAALVTVLVIVILVGSVALERVTNKLVEHPPGPGGPSHDSGR